MKTTPFKTFKNPSTVSKHHVCLTKKELKQFEKDVEEIQTILNKEAGRDLGFSPEAIASISGFMYTIATMNVKKKFEKFSAVMFGFGLFISKVIIAKYGGAIIKDRINGEIDVVVPHGKLGAYRVFCPHRIIIDLFYKSNEGVDTYLELIDGIMDISPSEIIEEIIN